MQKIKDLAASNAVTWGTIADSIDANFLETITEHQDISGKQDKLVSGVNIKTVNGKSILGSGNVEIATQTSNKLYTNKLVSVLGDSISTFNGYNPSDERKPTYPVGDVTSWTDTWWGYIINKLGMQLGMNDSWSGSMVFNGSDTDSPAGNAGPNICMASVKRTSNLGVNGSPHLVFFYGGTNDIRFIKGGSPKLGSFDNTLDYSTVDLDSTKWSTFMDAYVAAIQRLQYYYPNALIVAISPMYASNETWCDWKSLDDLAKEVDKVCNYFGVLHIDARKCGVKYSNTNKILRDGLHPSKIGMKVLAEYIISQVEPILANFPFIGATEPEVNKLTKLSTPSVSISEDGIASWSAVDNATKYAYSINNATAIETSEMSVQLTNGQKIRVKAIGDKVNYSDSDYSASLTYNDSSEEIIPVQLDTPLVTINLEGVASWNAVDNASSYVYSIDNGVDISTSSLNVQLTNGQTIKVKAVGDNINYLDSEYSNPVTYEEINVEIPSETTWYCDFTDLGGNYNYSSQTQGAVGYQNESTLSSMTGVPINAIKVLVANEGTMGVIKCAPDGQTIEHFCDVTLTNGSTDSANAVATVFKLPKTLILGDGERIGLMEFGYPKDGPYPSIWVKTGSVPEEAKVYTNMRPTGNGAKVENWALPAGIGYVVD